MHGRDNIVDPISGSSTFPFTMPSSAHNPSTAGFDVMSPVVIIGANGSGKSRLGKWMEYDSVHADLVFRISAQKSLKIPFSTQFGSSEYAAFELRYGISGDQQYMRDNPKNFKNGSRWGGHPATHLLDDYGALLKFLYSDHADKLFSANEEARVGTADPKLIESKLTKTIDLWESLLPHRRLQLLSGRIDVKYADVSTESYNAADMSDGERVILYLIGQVMSAEEGQIIIVDEPELHIHKTIQGILWDKLESARPDCLLVYMTHDVEFAASRSGSTKFWLKAYMGNNVWDWETVPQSDEIPESLLMSILGSRKDVIFVEGQRGSLDETIYNFIYENKTIIPRGGCDSVIASAKSFYEMSSLHRIKSNGVVDRDYRSDQEIERLALYGIEATKVSEVENLLLVEELLLIVANRLSSTNPHNDVQNIKNKIIAKLTTERERLASSKTRHYIERTMLGLSGREVGENAISNELDTLISSIDVPKIYNTFITEIDGAISSRNYAEVLKLYNNKGLIPLVCAEFGVKQSRLIEVIKSILRSQDGAPALTAMRALCPAF
ncbi:DUF4435 domain-containing protein [Deinococcus sp. 14RED07]|uniref:DUF4435 domain-containing protein n=1 Tax=Deinococcus sp. 14RED07 TaxID=2745874 RepID=UPI001E4B17AF|nr:DUF4435 domain-containing protein [Deinococcus sp. 14RED07]